MDVRDLVQAKARAARDAARALALCPTKIKNDALVQMAHGLVEKAGSLLEANRADVERAQGRGATRAFLDRLTLTESRLEEMAQGLREIAALPDPVGTVVEVWRRPNGIEISRVRVPLGVVGFIYESRPNVTADAAGLCVKSGNAVILRGGSEAIDSNTMIAAVLAKAVEKAGGPADAIQFIETTDREAVAALLELGGLVDLIIPRGGEEFVRWVAERSRIPVLKHDKGLVHVFVDASADPAMAAQIVVNAKAQRPGVCNALETLLVHREIAPRLLPALAARLAEAGVEVRGCPRTRALVPSTRPATDADWDTEYLDLILAVLVVDDLDAAITHIHRHGTGLAEAIVTNDLGHARRFTREVDAAAVLVNASTRLVDGSQFGMGAEMGISTSRVHARGPVGVRELTTTKFVVVGDGQVRE
ncbi:MAG: glutamate-5-semialdehyde dehydrogenase [Candidatus Rokubacteria bacterium 13_1_20CM_2_69_58]|jgi:glutamate-5-semialdehyde dehydrogenase|nr:MAG: glutamate-5-semialdehyde dehydrogenase [Candidatus Rokubacteria bacterium 13_1_40CM_3_69_38]OLD28835.1 MAG: glutamate-5-semialdehyde dehydrogenase [Candidatus Rokubacteria bacterium 13_1_40CM_2_70_45]OLD78131.1 MAG: glutamate-5-semialdehyde dehydrogenase [Candidatus Rokubacteria bacterium 13_1_20CM_4_70_14]OLE50077.1 MAG: glutamate-5-semialdehyde dehydrogenase [Candidatus Rokubacteria bacterium 13_1_20CM_2_69_58]PYM50106.1 MAG: glutamate-5-semialdehyde dehydrogenase [Candidatus Rokubact